jgi:hypothetical protein
MPEPIVMPNEGYARTEYCPRWHWENGSLSYGPMFSAPVMVQAFLDKPPAGVDRGEMVERTITTTPWEPVLPPGVLRLDQVRAQEYGGIKVAELGDGVAEGYTVVAFTDDVEKAFAAVRAHMAMVHNEASTLSLFHEGEPVRWWQVYGTCGCGNTCPHNEEEDHEGCKRTGLPPCWPDNEDHMTWEGTLCDKDAPGALPVVEIEVVDAFTPDERLTVLRLTLREAEEKLGALVKACLTTKSTLDQPYPDALETTPWKRFVERPAKDADFLRTAIRRELAWRTVGVAPLEPKAEKALSSPSPSQEGGTDG